MTHIQQMLSTHPGEIPINREVLVSTIDAINTCAETCEACADACLAEDDVQSLRHCIRTDLDCADVCRTTAAMLIRQTEPNWVVIQAQLQACITACQACGAECQSHAEHHEHCRICAEMCRKCEEACAQMLAVLPVTV